MYCDHTHVVILSGPSPIPEAHSLLLVSPPHFYVLYAHLCVCRGGGELLCDPGLLSAVVLVRDVVYGSSASDLTLEKEAKVHSQKKRMVFSVWGLLYPNLMLPQGLHRYHTSATPGQTASEKAVLLSHKRVMIHKYTHRHFYIYMHAHTLCVCVCVCVKQLRKSPKAKGRKCEREQVDTWECLEGGKGKEEIM